MFALPPKADIWICFAHSAQQISTRDTAGVICRLRNRNGLCYAIRKLSGNFRLNYHLLTHCFAEIVIFLPVFPRGGASITGRDARGADSWAGSRDRSPLQYREPAGTAETGAAGPHGKTRPVRG